MTVEMRDWLSHRARATPRKVATIEADDGAARTYADLDERVEELSGRLAALGVGVGDHLGVVLGTRSAFVELVHAAMRLGAVLVPLNARLTARELADRVGRADLDLFVCGRDTEEVAREVTVAGGGTNGGTGGADEDGDEDDDEALPLASVDAPREESRGEVVAVEGTDPATFDLPAWDHDNPQVVLFTSGTTGRPKAVTLTTGNLFASACGSAFRLGVLPADRWHCCLPMYHMGGLAPVYRSVLYGTAIVVQEGFDAEATLAAMRQHDATGVSLVPTMLRRLLDAGDPPESLRFVLLGGAPASRELVERCAERGVPACPTYGTTETASQVTTARPAEAFATPDAVGNPLLFTDVAVVGESGGERPRGEPGEIVVSGPTVMQGYYDDPAATERALDADGFHTGDVGYLDDEGRLYVLNRLDDRILTGGENVDPGEVVEALRAHPAVRDAAVVDLDDPEWGQRVAALVVAADLDRDALDAHCRDRLADFQRPKTVAIADSLPRTVSGTVDREAVRERLRAAADA